MKIIFVDIPGLLNKLEFFKFNATVYLEILHSEEFVWICNSK